MARVLDHQALGGPHGPARDQPIQPAQGGDISLGVGLSPNDILGGDHHGRELRVGNPGPVVIQ